MRRPGGVTKGHPRGWIPTSGCSCAPALPLPREVGCTVLPPAMIEPVGFLLQGPAASLTELCVKKTALGDPQRPRLDRTCFSSTFPGWCQAASHTLSAVVFAYAPSTEPQAGRPASSFPLYNSADLLLSHFFKVQHQAHLLQEASLTLPGRTFCPPQRISPLWVHPTSCLA